MNLEKTIKGKDKIIQQLIERLETCQHRLSYIENVTLKVQKIFKRHSDGNLEVLMINDVHNTPDGVIVEVD